jgi:hypothetical protein
MFSFDTKLIIVAVVVNLFAFGFLVLVGLRNGPEIRTQTNLQTGEKRSGILAWGLLLFGIPDVPLGLLWITHDYILPAAVWLVAHLWVVPVVGSLVLLGIIGWVAVRNHRRRPHVEPQPQAELPHNPIPTGPLPAAIPAVPTEAMWGLPAEAPQWSER